MSGGVILARRMDDSSSKLLWIQGIGLDHNDIKDLSLFLQGANVPFSFIVSDDSLQFLDKTEVAAKLQETIEALLKPVPQMDSSPINHLWA